jgi:hypothetical protein
MHFSESVLQITPETGLKTKAPSFFVGLCYYSDTFQSPYLAIFRKLVVFSICAINGKKPSTDFIQFIFSDTWHLLFLTNKHEMGARLENSFSLSLSLLQQRRRRQPHQQQHQHGHKE